MLVNGINQLLGNYGSTIDPDNPLQTKQGIDQDMDRLLEELKAGSVKALVIWGVNPVYDHPRGIDFATAIKKAELSISFSERPDETTALCMFSLPETNFLESWNDLDPKQAFTAWPNQPLHPCLTPGRLRKHCSNGQVTI